MLKIQINHSFKKHLTPNVSRQCVSVWNKDMKEKKRAKEIKITATCPQEINCPAGKTNN